MEPSDIGTLHTIQKIVSAYSSLGLEVLCENNPNYAVQLLKANHPQVLFRHGLTLLREAQIEFTRIAGELKLFHIASYKHMVAKQKWVKLQENIILDANNFKNSADLLMFTGAFHQFPYFYGSKQKQPQQYIDSIELLDTWKTQIIKAIKETKI